MKHRVWRISPNLNSIFFKKCLFLTWYIFRLWRDLNCFKTFFFFFFFGSTENCFSLFHIYSNKSEK